VVIFLILKTTKRHPYDGYSIYMPSLIPSSSLPCRHDRPSTFFFVKNQS